MREEGLLAEGDFAGQQQQIGGQRDERDDADIGQDADQMVVHRSRLLRHRRLVGRACRATRPAAAPERRTARHRRRDRESAARNTIGCAPRRRRAASRRQPRRGSSRARRSSWRSGPFNVAHMPNIGVTCWSAASTRKPATPPIAERQRKGQQHGAAGHRSRRECAATRIADDGAQAEAEPGAVEQQMHGRRQRERAGAA